MRWALPLAVCMVQLISPVPAQEEVYFDAGDLQGSSMAPIEPGPAGIGYAASEIEGRACISTDAARNMHWLVFDVPDGFGHGGGPLTLVITYLDAPEALLSVRYDAQDLDLGVRAGPLGQACEFMRTGSGQWVTAAFQLPIPNFTNRCQQVGDIAVMGWTFANHPLGADVSVARIALTTRVLDVGCNPDTLAMGEGQQSISAMAFCRVGQAPAPDGSQVEFKDSEGVLIATADTIDGVATAELPIPPEPGWHTVHASWGDLPASSAVCVLPGPGPVRAVEAELEGFNEQRRYPTIGVGGTKTESMWQNAFKAGGEGGLRVDYTFDPAQGGPYFVLPLEVQAPGRPTRLRMGLYGDGSGHWVQLVLRDAEGEHFTCDVGRLTFSGWREILCYPDEATPSGGNPEGCNQVIDFPVTLAAAHVACWVDGVTMKGVVGFDEIWADCQVAEPPGE